MPTQPTQNKRAVCYIPSGEMLRLRPVRHWLTRFSDFARRSATDVALPAIGFRGPYYESRVHPFPPAYKRNDLLPAWIKAAREAIGENGTVWATILVEGGFFATGAIDLRNQYGGELDQVCITNPISQAIFQDLIDEINSFGIDGVVLDICDIYPNSGSSGYTGISAHCFCDDCMDALSLKGFTEARESFMGNSGLMRFVLRVDKDGAAHIDPPQDWLDNRDSRALVNLALARRFVEGDLATLEPDGRRLLEYFAARVQVTAEALKATLRPAKDANKRTAIVVGSVDADLSQLVTLQSLDGAKTADEYWVPDPPKRKKAPGEWRAQQFLSSRSTYYYNNFFQVIEDSSEIVVAGGVDTLLKQLLDTSKRLVGQRMTAGAAYTAEKLEQVLGIVGIPLGEDDHLEIVERLTKELTGGVLPPELLDRFRIADPDKK